MTFFLHPNGRCESSTIGEGTRIWAFAHVLAGARIERECNICDHVFIENDVVLGDRVTVKCGVQLWDGLRAEDDTFIGPNATFTNDRFPRSRQYQGTIPRTILRKGASIGANATILPGVVIGENAMVGAGAVVTSDVQPNAIVTGNPARVVGYVDAVGSSATDGPVVTGAAQPRTPTLVNGVALHRLKLVEDARGSLAVAEVTADIPFVPQRVFVIFDVPSHWVRGEHALRTCDQFLVCLKGHCQVVVGDGDTRQEIRLDQPDIGLFVPAMTWLTMYRFSPDALLQVMASTPYDSNDYIRDYQEFLREVRSSAG